MATTDTPMPMDMVLATTDMPTTDTTDINDSNDTESRVDNDFYHTPQHRIEAAFRRTPQSTSPRRTRRKPKVKSLYDEDHYALPDMSSNTSREDSDSTSRDENVLKSFW